MRGAKGGYVSSRNAVVWSPSALLIHRMQMQCSYLAGSANLRRELTAIFEHWEVVLGGGHMNWGGDTSKVMGNGQGAGWGAKGGTRSYYYCECL